MKFLGNIEVSKLETIIFWAVMAFATYGLFSFVLDIFNWVL